MSVLSEKEKMISGEFYNPRDPELLEMYHKARKLMKELNQLDSRNAKRRNSLIRELLGSAGSGLWIESPFYVNYGENIHIGEHTFVNMNCVFLDDGIITIGKNGLIAPSVQIYTATHPVSAKERIVSMEDFEKDQNGLVDKKISAPKYRTYAKPVTIGHNVWIGGNAVIMPGVVIGNNVTIGAGSVVTRSIPDGVVAVGNPCRVVRKIDP
jgi:maltose O-acetyltransferase